MTYTFRKNIALSFRFGTIFTNLIQYNLISHNEELAGTNITVVEIAVHLPFDDTFSVSIKYKMQKKAIFHFYWFKCLMWSV